MEEIKYVERKNSNCNKWDEQTGMFGEENSIQSPINGILIIKIKKMKNIK